jgi:hypothetical protein
MFNREAVGLSAMRRIIALGLVGVMSLASVPAFAQQGTKSQPGQNPDQTTNPQYVDTSGLNSLGQAPPPNNDNNDNNDSTAKALAAAGLAAGAIGGIVALVLSHHSDNNPVSP